MPTDASGNMTGHLIGLLYRALLCKELGIDTVWVFDGKPPSQKYDELYRRRHMKEQAAELSEKARE
jgi:flap endonuclease-1